MTSMQWAARSPCTCCSVSHPPEPRPVHGRRDGRRGGVLVHLDGALVPGPADGDGRRRRRSRSATSTPRTRASRPASRSPAGSASSRCGRRSAAPTPSCSTDAVPARARQPPPRRRGFLDTASPEALFVLSAVAQYIGRDDRRPAVRRGRAADRRLAARHRRGDRAARRVAAAFWRGWTRRAARRGGRLRHRHGG